MTTFQTTKCTTGANWTSRDMTAAEMEQIGRAISGHGNATVTGVHVSERGVEIWYAVNYLSQAKYPNNHREYQATLTAREWQGWF